MRTVPTAMGTASQQPGPGLGSVVSSRYPQYRIESQPEAALRACCRRTALEQASTGRTTTSQLTAPMTSVLSPPLSQCVAASARYLRTTGVTAWSSSAKCTCLSDYV
jgi:hypothetical protein